MRAAVLLVALAAALWGCAHPGDGEFTPADRTSILLKDSRFSRTVPTILAREIFCGHQEAAIWVGVKGVASIILLQADAGCVVQEPMETGEELVRKFDWLNEGKLKFGGTARMVEGPHGAIWTLPFKRDDRDCFFFKHDFGYESISDVTGVESSRRRILLRPAGRDEHGYRNPELPRQRYHREAVPTQRNADRRGVPFRCKILNRSTPGWTLRHFV